MDTKKGCKTCAHEAGCLKKGLMKFFFFILPGRDQELRHMEKDPGKDLLCPEWEEKTTDDAHD